MKIITETCPECGGSGEVLGGEDCYFCTDVDYSEPFCWSKSLDSLTDAILLYCASVEKELETAAK